MTLSGCHCKFRRRYNRERPSEVWSKLRSKLWLPKLPRLSPRPDKQLYIVLINLKTNHSGDRSAKENVRAAELALVSLGRLLCGVKHTEYTFCASGTKRTCANALLLHWTFSCSVEFCETRVSNRYYSFSIKGQCTIRTQNQLAQILFSRALRDLTITTSSKSRQNMIPLMKSSSNVFCAKSY